MSPYSAFTILIADDSSNICQIYGVILRAVGLRNVRYASSAEEAWESIEWLRPDVLITDQQMPGEDGIEFIRRLRVSGDSPDPFLPALLVTAWASRKVAAEARDAGAHDVIVKPFKPATLLTRLSQILDEPRAFVEAPGFFGPDRRRGGPPPTDAPRRRASDAALMSL